MKRIVVRNTLSVVSAMMIFYACATTSELESFVTPPSSEIVIDMSTEISKKKKTKQASSNGAEKSAEKSAEKNTEQSTLERAGQSTEQIVESIQSDLRSNRSSNKNTEKQNQQPAKAAALDSGAISTDATTSTANQAKNPPPEASIASVSELNPNRFNRLLEKRGSKSEELLDPDNPFLKYLQKPSEAFKDLPKAKTGNMVDWVSAIDSGKINPRHDLHDQNVKPIVMDLNIVMEVKGSMPDVVFPHRVHTRWLDCSNCHPAIFIPQSGANKMSMADNLLGKRCGLCHGKVAFPLSSCTKCHSNKKVVVKEKK